MDQPLHNHPCSRSNQTSATLRFPTNVQVHCWKDPSLCGVIGLVIGMFSFLTSGCQLAPRVSQLELPPPPVHLESAEPAAVRMQSPDSTEHHANTTTTSDNRVRSFNQELHNLSLSNPSLYENQSNTEPTNRQNLVSEVIITGNHRIPTHHLTRNIRTRPGRYFDPDRLQQDVDQLWRMPEISRVNGPYIKETSDGVVVNIEVVERPVITELNFIGNRGITDRQLKKETGLVDGAPLDVNDIRMAKSKIEELYKKRGYPRTQVEILEGSETKDSKVVFLIHEDQKQRIWKAEFEGNQIASDARLRHFIESKPGYLKMVGGLVNRDEIEQDILRLTNYYRSLGFFNARIGREISESNDGRWLTVRFFINEGPRYRVRSVSFIGNQAFEANQLETLVKLRPDGEEAGQPEFNAAKMNQDVVTLRDLYGGQGYVFANVEAEPRFLEEPGLLDLVYKIDEGKQYRVGNINVHFDGDYGITKREVVLNRLSCRPGDLIDVREIRDSERRLGAASIFAGAGAPGAQGPKIVVRPPELKELERQAAAESSYR